MPFLSPNQQCHSTEGNDSYSVYEDKNALSACGETAVCKNTRLHSVDFREVCRDFLKILPQIKISELNGGMLTVVI